jgi:signal transduction histidine kinase/CheY-like chemotaxis protein
VLCVPLVQQARVVGLLYLENSALAGAFGDDLVEVVQVLAAQAVISLENALLHEASRREIAQRRQAEQALSEADRRKDEFLAMLAHELRNPLAPIRSASEVLALKLAAQPAVQGTIGIIRRQVTQLTRLVDDLLDVSRVTQGRIQLDRRPIALADVVASAVEAVEPLVAAKKQRLALAASAEPLFVDGDLARLTQCVANILTNAAKYTEAAGAIRLRTRAEGREAVVEIQDSGIGIAPRLLPQVFDLFVQGERTIDRSQGGLGIGLSIVKRLVQMHDGEVTAHSDGEGRGSTFTIRLPRIEPPASAAAAREHAEAARGRVLVVDDNEDAANSLAMLLQVQGHETSVAYDGTAALQSVASFQPGLVLLDLGLPGMDGYEIARRIRALPESDRIRLVALSGYGQPEDRRRTKAAGFDEHLVKPVDTGALQQVLSSFLE